MTAPDIDTSEVIGEEAHVNAPWVAPVVKRLRAGDAEDGFDPIVVDGLLTYS